MLVETDKWYWLWYSTKELAESAHALSPKIDPEAKIGSVVEAIINDKLMFGFRISKEGAE